MSAVKTQFQEELEKENQFNLEEMEYESQQNLSQGVLEGIEDQERKFGEEREDTRDPDEMRENYLSGVNYI